jgi:hypothetical protein
LTLTKLLRYLLLSGKADMIFAVRLPQDTFAKSAGTAVSVDIQVWPSASD